ncbi:ABC transporter ATP-binding protein [Rhizobium ruizarguesonis]|uniref:ABC transporter ATP-binding protein n=1 Tax=Rhizobium ruizarguesonis TaxID=2081791 RepID=A0AAE8QB85_9HYPH|nr:ABC transporter ATP-binding protein [Rhizobium ruizarguesonis]TAV04250.1 ABC transporter ATP-binding protein [Rhizobium ruizarguesonis]TBA79191.1 ABC transporter ATP-binding protein [Rhizobium ruizarguesonis]TBA83970.1 ABC transporter ATP-binding protein [Rhizobium ruizarguesonis]TBB10095.1 ABC transporter ATP-binding protein [Rhizobium ruizarguesonis]TBB20775.1 ABC transporter ATP-binding protein [Rhizobium ruizarguesonis]
MNDIVISVENVSKLYRLGAINHGTLYRDLQSWWARLRGKADPNSPIDTPRSNSAVQSEQWFKALDGIDFEVTRGEVLGLIGGNGAGKSTLLKILSRITAPSSGEVRMKGRIASLLEVGTGFHPELTGRENVFLNGALLGMAPTEVSKKFDEIVDFAGVETFIDTPVKRYSSGMYVRLAFAVAAHLESEVLLVDEVLAVGDTAFQKKCLGKMEDIGASGRTILFVSHNMAAIENLCQKVLVLDRGKVDFFGDTPSGVEHYYSKVNSNVVGHLDALPRTGDGRLRLKEVWVSDAQGNQLAIIRTGSTVKINVKIERIEPGREDLSLAIGVKTLKGDGVIHLSTETLAFNPQISEQFITLSCELKRFNLRGGIYSLNFYLSTSGVVSDWVQDGFRIQVEDGDYYGTGKLPPEGYSHYLADYSWSVTNNDP